MESYVSDSALRILNETESRETALQGLGDVAQALETAWISICSYLVFSMQIGFAMLTAGSIRTKNVKVGTRIHCKE